MEFEAWFQQKYPDISSRSVSAVLKLTAEEATVPFIARYRKEQTGNLDEVGIRAVIENREKWDKLVSRKAHVLKEIEAQGKLTPELKAKIEQTFQPEILEDLYLPYRQKKKSKAGLAREAGLEPLADWIWNCGHGTEKPLEGQTLDIWAFTFRNEEKGFTDAEKAIAGASDILIERLSEIYELRELVRRNIQEKGFLVAAKTNSAKPNSKYEKYFDYREPLGSLIQEQNSHRYLAMRRGWLEKELSLAMSGSAEDTEFEARLLKAFTDAAVTVPDFSGAAVLQKCATRALKEHVFPSIERETHRALKEVADEIAVQVFVENVRTVLLSPPYGSKAVLGIDPGIRTGCKIALVDDSGKYIGSGVFFFNSEAEKETAKKAISELFTMIKIQAIAVGNGTHGRETELFIRDILKEQKVDVPVVMVSEAGASVYSASETAREEFPDLDVTVRGAISIARRLQDPLAELVKIDPKSIGVGQYQHDISPPVLKKNLDNVVDSCVNSVGVNLNTASYHLLAHVSGIGEALAKNIVSFRGEKGLFKSRDALKEVPHFSTRSFQQSAGFLRVPGAENPLDNTAVHPESYGVLEEASKKLGKSVKELMGTGAEALKSNAELKSALGEFTFEDIIEELSKPGRDPRDVFIPFSYRDDIRELKDVKAGMICPGIVTNVTNFGAFVDIGVHQDGLVHISQLADRFVKDPRDVVKPGQRVKVKVLEINLEKNQIAFTMKNVTERPPAPRPQPQQQQQRGRPDNRPRRPPRNQFKNDAFAVLAALKVKK